SRSQPRGLLQGVPAQQLGRRGGLRRHRRGLCAAVNDESQLALTRFDFTSGSNRGSQLLLYPRCLVHRSESQLETVPLSRVTAIKVSFKRDPRRLGWGIACGLTALLLLAISSPLGTFAHGAAQELTASGQGVARALYSLLRFMEVLAALLPAIALAGAVGEIGRASCRERVCLVV